MNEEKKHEEMINERLRRGDFWMIWFITLFLLLCLQEEKGNHLLSWMALGSIPIITICLGYMWNEVY